VEENNVIKLVEPGTFVDGLTEVLRNGARKLLTQAVETEVADFIGRHCGLVTEEGRRRIVRHGHLPEREIMTGIGPVPVRAARVRDRVGQGEARIRFSSTILPAYARRSKSLEELIPILYLRGISSGDFEEALSALLGMDAGGLSASTIARLKDVWTDEYLYWEKRDLSAKSYVYMWADGIHVQARLEDEAQCLLVIIGATPEGKKEFVGLTVGCARARRIYLSGKVSESTPRDSSIGAHKMAKSPTRSGCASRPGSRTRGARTGTGPMPVMISRSGRCPWRTTR
jgi:putative transposase